MCKSAIPYIFKTLKKIVISRDVYEHFLYVWYDERHFKPITEQFQSLSKNVLTNLNIHPSSINGLTILTHILIWKSHKKRFASSIKEEKINR